MPITPFHFGLGAALSSVAPRHVGFVAFCAVNVVIDVESLIHLVIGEYPVHTFLHTYVGSSLAAVATFLAFCVLFRVPAIRGLAALFGSDGLGVLPVAVGCAIGAYSHVLLDSIMHRDMIPLSPFARSNDMLGVVSLTTLHLVCLVGFVFAACVIGIRGLLGRNLKP